MDFDEALKEIAARDCGAENAEKVVECWKLWSDGIRHYVSTNPDQYGPFRIGPAYPLLYQKEAVLQSPPYAHFGGNHICQTMYNYDINKRANLDFEIESLSEMERLYREGAKILEEILPTLSGRQYEETKRLWALGSFIANAAHTTVNVKRWFIQKCRILPPKTNRPIWSGGQSEDVEGGAEVSLTREEKQEIVKKMHAIAADEIENAGRTIPLVEYDSRLGYEPSMEYMCDRKHLEWKIAMTERALTELDEELAKA